MCFDATFAPAEPAVGDVAASVVSGSVAVSGSIEKPVNTDFGFTSDASQTISKNASPVIALIARRLRARK
jgi:hypothetical protein